MATTNDKEIAALIKVDRELQKLNVEQIKRILQFSLKKWGFSPVHDQRGVWFNLK
jgi:hypothetical protein